MFDFDYIIFFFICDEGGNGICNMGPPKTLTKTLFVEKEKVMFDLNYIKNYVFFFKLCYFPRWFNI